MKPETRRVLGSVGGLLLVGFLVSVAVPFGCGLIGFGAVSLLSDPPSRPEQVVTSDQTPAQRTAAIERWARRTWDCSEDCSGHIAGWEWADRNAVTEPEECRNHSRSFEEGCRTSVAQGLLETETDHFQSGR